MAGPSRIEKLTLSERLEFTKPSLTNIVRDIIHYPQNQLGKDNYVGLLHDFASALASDSPAHTPELIGTSCYLRAALDHPSFQDPKSTQITIRSLLVADMLLCQTTLPLEERYVEKSEKKHKKDSIPYIEPADTLPSEEAESLKGSIEAFRKTLEKHLEVPSIEPEKAKVQLGIADKIISAYADNLSNLSKVLGDPEFQKLRESLFKLVHNIARSSLTYELFVTKQLEDMDDILKDYVWVCQWGSIVKANEPNSREKIGKLCEYFLETPFLPEFFLDNQLRHFRLDVKDHLLPGLYEQPPNVIRDFLSAIPIKELDKSERIAILRKLLGSSGFLFHNYPSYANNKEMIIEQLRQTAKDLEIDSALSTEFAILSDEKPGALKKAHFRDEVRVVIPKPGQTKEEFEELLDRQQLEELREVLYISKAWSDVEKPKENAEPVKDTLSIALSETQWTSRWGEVQIPKRQDVPLILEWINSTFCAKLDCEKLLKLATDYERRLIPNADILVLPDLLPNSHDLSPLRKIGVVAIEQNGNHTVNFVIDPKVAKIETAQRIVIEGKMVRTGDLVIDDANDDFALSPLHLLLTAAELLRRKKFREWFPTKEETREIHQKVKSWNRENKGIIPSSLEYLEQGIRREEQGLALYPLDPLGNKIILLSLANRKIEK